MKNSRFLLASPSPTTFKASLRSATLCASILVLSGCATMRSNTFIGASVGASAGAVSGMLIGAPHHAGSGTLIGAASGLALGALIGYLTEPKATPSPEPARTYSVGTDPNDPAFTSPEVRRIWVPDKIDGNKYVKGHYMYVLERGSVWTMP